MEKLKQSKIRFDSDAHRYFLGALELRGITRLINERLGFEQPSEYVDFSKGTAVHEEIELISMGIEPATEEGKRFAEWVKTNNVNIIANEYIVSDEEKFASPIDFVTDDLTIWDVKTFRSFTNENLQKVTWQLSIYAYLFHSQNGFKVNGAKVIKVNDDGCVVRDVELIDEEEVKKMLYSQNDFVNVLTKTDTNDEVLAKLQETENLIKEIETRQKQLTEMRDEYRRIIIERMEAEKVMKWETDSIRINYVAPSTRKSVDTAKLKADYPDVYFECAREIETKASLRVTIKN